MNDGTPLPPNSTPVTARPIAGAPALPPPSSPLHDFELRGLTRREAGLDLMIIVLAMVVLPFLPTAFTPLMSSEGKFAIPSIDIAIVVDKWCQAALACCLLLYFVMRQRISSSAFGLTLRRLGQQTTWALISLVMTYAALLASLAVVLSLLALIPGLESEIEQRADFASKLPLDSMTTIVLLLIAVAIHEEVVFRALLLPYLRRLMGSWWSAGLLAALIFGMLHVPAQGLLGGVQTFAIGAALVCCYLASRSLLAVTIAHFLFDLFQFQLMRSEWLRELLENLPPAS